jgi:hypothetical protein
VCPEKHGERPAFDGVEMRLSATTHPVKARARSLKLRKSVGRNMLALAEARSRIAKSGLSPEARRLRPEVVLGGPLPVSPHDREAGCVRSKRLLSLQPREQILQQMFYEQQKFMLYLCLSLAYPRTLPGETRKGGVRRL